MTCSICQRAHTPIAPMHRTICPRCQMGTILLDSTTRGTGDSALAQADMLLQVAVPLWIAQLQDKDDVAFQDTLLLWRSDQWNSDQGTFSEALVRKIPGQTATGFNALARCLASMAFHPGGVPFGTIRYYAFRTHADWQRAQDDGVGC